MTKQNKPDDGGAAFPGSQPTNPDGQWASDWDPGMTMLDWFAGRAMQSMMGTQDQMASISKQAREEKVNPVELIARAAYEFADAMIQERKRRFGGSNGGSDE